MDYTGQSFIDDIMKEIGEITTNTNYRLFVLNWLQEGFDIVVSELDGHPFLNVVYAFSTADGTNGYNVVSGSLIPGNIIAVRNKTTNKVLDYYDLQEIKNTRLDLESEGNPLYYYQYGYDLTYSSSLIYFYPIPDAIYSMEVTYKLNSYKFADTSAVLYIPRYLISLLRMYVRSLAFLREGDIEQYNAQLNAFYLQLKRQGKTKHTIADVKRLSVSDLPSRSNQSRAERDTFFFGSIGTQSPTGFASVGVAVPSFMSVSGSPLTSSGTITLSFGNQSGRVVLAAPANGSSGAPTFRALVSADISDLSAGSGTVNSVSVVTANGVSGTVATATTTPAITITLGAITPTTVNGLTITTTTGTLTITNGKTLSVSNTLTFTGTDASSVAFGTGGTVVYTSNTLAVHAATTSAQLAGIISDETGSGSLVFATSPTLVTPVLGVATATSINKVTITAPATGSTLTIADGKTLTVSNSVTLSGTDSSTITFGAGGTVVYTTTTQTLQNKTLDNTNTLSIKDTLFRIQDDGDATKLLAFQLSGITTGNTRVLTVPNFDGTIATLAGTETLTNKTLVGANNSISGITEAMQTLADNTTNNASTSNHGYLKKLSNVSTEFMNGQGNWAVPAGGTSTLVVCQANAVVHTSTSENTELTYTVTANTLTADGGFRFKALILIDVTGFGLTLTWKLKFGGTTMHTSFLSIAAGVYLMELTWDCFNANVTNLQYSRSKAHAYTTGAFSSGYATYTDSFSNNTASIDTTANKDIVFTLQYNYSDPTVKYQVLGMTVDILHL